MNKGAWIVLVWWVGLGITGQALDPVAPIETGFEEFGEGGVTSLNADYGTWKAEPGHAEIEVPHARTGKKCLHILGGDDRVVELILDHGRGDLSRLSFWAERWTSRNPFKFRIEAFIDGEWQEVYNGDREVKVGRSYLSEVIIPLPRAPIDKFRFLCTAPSNSGVLIDDLRLSVPTKMTVQEVTVSRPVAPVLIGKERNPLLQVKVAVNGDLDPLRVTALRINTRGNTDLKDLDKVQVYYSGAGESFTTNQPFGEATAPAANLVLKGDQVLRDGVNSFWVACRLKDGADLDHVVDAGCEAIQLNGNQTHRLEAPSSPARKRIGYAVRQAGQDGIHTYRIPGLATTRSGSLIAVYDNRHQGGGDLPGFITVGMSRSTDRGQSWDPMKIIMDMGNHDGFRGNGIGDPSVLVDRVTGRIWVAAVWSHGNRGWHGSGPGLDPEETGQFMLVYSDDDGVTWSKPVNITKQIKRPEWCFLLQGPGKGITLRDGTLVFPAQFQDTPDNKRVPYSTIVYSRDHGKTWQIGTGAKPNTTESQVVELDDGSLMLNMRDNRGGSRSVYVTRDLGQTWEEHPTSRKALPEPVCMASLIRFSSRKDGARQSLLMFSNPNSTRGRHHLSIKVSEDEGMTWPDQYHKLLYEPSCFGYSCMTVVDKNHVGILYEGRRELYFERIPVQELISKTSVY